MTQVGIAHLLSMIYLSVVICLAISVNENRDPRRILRETLRRWLKFAGLTLVIALIVILLD